MGVLGASIATDAQHTTKATGRHCIEMMVLLVWTDVRLPPNDFVAATRACALAFVAIDLRFFT